MVDVDAATDLGRLLSLDPTHAHLVTTSIVSNPIEGPMGISPGFMGTVTTTPPVHCAGIDPTPDWVAQARQRIKVPGDTQALIDLALLSQLASVTRASCPKPSARGERHLGRDRHGMARASRARAGVDRRDAPQGDRRDGPADGRGARQAPAQWC